MQVLKIVEISSFFLIISKAKLFNSVIFIFTESTNQNGHPVEWYSVASRWEMDSIGNRL